MGAVLLHEAVWVLPATPQTREHFQWLASEIREQGSEATVWEAYLTMSDQDEELVRHFLEQVDRQYEAISTELAGADPDLPGLARRYQQVQAQDYFQSERGRQIREALMRAEKEPSR
jgi:hypothetical protein